MCEADIFLVGYDKLLASMEEDMFNLWKCHVANHDDE